MGTTHNSLKNNQSGIAHLGLIILILIVVGVLGGVGYRVYQTSQGESVEVVSQETIVEEDEDVDGEVLPEPVTDTEEPVDIEPDNSAASTE